MTQPPARPVTGDERLDSLLRMNTELLSELLDSPRPRHGS